MLFDFLTVLLGCFGIVMLSYLIIRETIDVGSYFALSGTFIGMTILSIGTSLPEILTHIMGSIRIMRFPELINPLSSLAIGTNIGSDIFQQNFILGIVAILGTVIIVKKEIPHLIGGLIGGTVVLFIVSINGIISRGEGAFLVIAYLAYLVYLRKKEKNPDTVLKNKISRKKLFIAMGLLLFAFVVMAFLAREVLKSAEVIVKALPISASFFGIIVIGIAAALPELTTSLVALKKKQGGMSAGVLIGSNITNPTFALGAGAVISTYHVPNVVIQYDLPFKILSCLLILFLLLKFKHLRKKEGVILIGVYFLYLIIRTIFFPIDTF